MILTRELVRRFEELQAEAVQSLLTRSLAEVPGNPEGYAIYGDGPIRAVLSTNPHAGWATQAYGATGQPAEALARLVRFFNGRGVPARVRIVPEGFTEEQADALGVLGLRHVAFHTILWAPLPIAAPGVAETLPPDSAEIRQVSTTADMDAHIDILLGVYGVPAAIIDRLRPLRRAWLGSAGRRFYLAWVAGRPAAGAVLYWRNDLAYLEAAGTLLAYRRRGLQRALVQRRIADATALGCRIVIGGAEFENESRTNQMACGLSVAYTAAVWRQRANSLRA
jgi:hypothetical protein